MQVQIQALDKEAIIASQIIAAWPYLDSTTRRSIAEFPELRFPNFKHLIDAIWKENVFLPKGHELKTIIGLMNKFGYSDEHLHAITRYYSAIHPQVLSEIKKYPAPYGVLYVQRETTQAVRDYLLEFYQLNKQPILDTLLTTYNNPTELVPELNKIIKIFSLEYDNSPRTFHDIIEAAKDENAVNLSYVIPTGFPTLDKSIGGGLQPKRMTLVQAGTGVGKTSLTLQILINAIKHERHSLYLSFEMSQEDIIYRLLSQMTQTPVDVLKNLIQTGQASQEILEKGAQIDKYVRCEFPGNTGVVSLVESALLDYMRINGKPPEIIVVDFLQLLSMGALRPPGSTRADDLEGVARLLYSYAKEYNTHLFALSQMTEDHSYGGRAAEHPCDLVLWLRESPDNINKRELEAKKNRFGPKGVVIPLTWWGHTTSFVESGQPSNMPEMEVQANQMVGQSEPASTVGNDAPSSEHPFENVTGSGTDYYALHSDDENNIPF